MKLLRGVACCCLICWCVPSASAAEAPSDTGLANCFGALDPHARSECPWWGSLDTTPLRRALRLCAQNAVQEQTRVFGGLSFEVQLGEGSVAIRTLPSAFDRTALPTCLRQALRKYFWAQRNAPLISFKGSFRLRSGNPDDFGFDLTVLLAAVTHLPLPALPGQFMQTESGWVSTCQVGDAVVVLRVSPPGSESGTWTAPGLAVSSIKAVDDCLSPVNDRHAVQTAACLSKLLSHSELSVQAAAALALADGRFWQERTALTQALEKAVRPANCPSRSCEAQAPSDATSGVSLVQMALAHWRLRHAVPDPVLAALARHPSVLVRNRLVRVLLSRWGKKLPGAALQLLADPDPLIRIRACEVGCQRENRESEQAFLAELKSPKPEIRAAAVLYAQSCVGRTSRQVTIAAGQEPVPIVALLMMQALKEVPDELMEARAGQALLDSCPATRMLASRLLTRSRLPALDKRLEEAKARETDPLLLQLLERLLKSTLPPPGETSPRGWEQGAMPDGTPQQELQLWLQPGSGPGKPPAP